MNKITQKMIKAVKAHSLATWHDAAWWTFENLPSTSKIQEALAFLGKNASLKEIEETANK
jgi:hypothetical protein